MSNSKNRIKEALFYVQGMHCPSCELLIEKNLLKNKNIKSVEASTGSGQVTIFYKRKKPSLNQLNQEFGKEGYVFSKEPAISPQTPPLISLNRQGQLLINKAKFLESFQVLGLAFLLIVVFVFFSRPSIASRVVVNSSSSFLAFLLFGLMAGFSSCAALVGGIILSMSKQWSGRFRPHFLFNFGRLISFGFFGALLGGLGFLFQLSLTSSALLAILVSIVMVILALQMLGVRSFQKFQIGAPKFITRFIADETNFKGHFMPFLLGALTFFLPCGFTLTSQGLALASGSSWRGALIMFSFALGTLPMLAAIGLSTVKLMAKPHLSAQFLKIAGILVLFFGIYNFNSQLNILGLPSLTDIKLPLSTPSQIVEDGLAPIVNGKQILKMDAFAYKYEPNEFKIRAGIPVRWEISNQGVSGCSNAIIAKGLFDGEVRLNKELNVKEFTPQNPGKYKFSCWMGMISGIITVVDENGVLAAPSGLEEEIPSGASGCGGAGGGGCTGGCGGGCGNPGCQYAQ